MAYTEELKGSKETATPQTGGGGGAGEKKAAASEPCGKEQKITHQKQAGNSGSTAMHLYISVSHLMIYGIMSQM